MAGSRGLAGSGRALCAWAELQEKGGEGGPAAEPWGQAAAGAAMKQEGSKGGPGQGRRENTAPRLAGPSQPMCAVCWGRAAAWWTTLPLSVVLPTWKPVVGCQVP